MTTNNTSKQSRLLTIAAMMLCAILVSNHAYAYGNDFLEKQDNYRAYANGQNRVHFQFPVYSRGTNDYYVGTESSDSYAYYMVKGSSSKVKVFYYGGQQDKNGPSADDDYSDADMWYVSTDSCAVADIFYVCSTETSDWVNAKGDTMHFADMNNAAHRAALLGEMRGVDSLVCPQGCNFYAPYYRQATIEGLLRDTALFRSRCAQAGEDVARAFRYYMDKINDGRKFVLMGYSQGGYIVVDLLKGLSADEHERLIAAYIIGYEVTAEDLANGNIRAAEGATDTGVTICYNSVSEPGAAIPVLSGKTAIGINPVNWCTDATEATYVFDFGGACDTITARLDTISHLTIISGYDGTCPLVPFAGSRGNYHCLEIPLYYRFLRENIALRCHKK